MAGRTCISGCGAGMDGRRAGAGSKRQVRCGLRCALGFTDEEIDAFVAKIELAEADGRARSGAADGRAGVDIGRAVCGGRQELRNGRCNRRSTKPSAATHRRRALATRARAHHVIALDAPLGRSCFQVLRRSCTGQIRQLRPRACFGRAKTRVDRIDGVAVTTCWRLL